MKEKNFISIYDNALTLEECKSLIDYFESDDESWSIRQEGRSDVLDESENGHTGIVNKKFKDSQDRSMILEIDGHYQNTFVNNIIIKSLKKYVEEYKKENPEINMLSRWCIRPMYNLQKYEPGGGYHVLHCENYNKGLQHTTTLVWMYYLNTVKEGGGTYFSNFDLTVNAVEGRLVLWPPYWTHMHRGVVSKTFEKYIATGWFSLSD